MKKISRNDPCLCGSGKKYKHCCERKDIVQAPNSHSREVSILIELQIAMAHHQDGRLAEAEAIYQQILRVETNHADALHLLGLIAHQRGNIEIAVDLIKKAINANPTEQRYHYNLGVTLQAQGHLNDAVICYRQALFIKPDNIEVYPNMGAALHAQGRLDEAVACYRQALLIKPDYADAYNNLGLALKDQARLDEAVTCFRQALMIKPDYVEAYCNLGITLHAQGRLDDAISCYRQAILFKPDYADARFNLAFALLRLGSFDEGWILYEARFEKNKTNRNTEIPGLSFPRWLGEDLREKSIVIWMEQGMGDEIQSVRYIPLLKTLGAAKVTLVCKAPLKSLFHSLSGADAVIAESEADQLGDNDFWTFQMSLPLHFKTTLETIPNTLPYLNADEIKLKYWSKQLPVDGLRIGLVWRGSEVHKNDANRSLPGLATLAPLWSVPGITFISLQKGQGEDEASNPPTGQPLIHLGSGIQDFSDTAAIVSQLDLVICVDTAIAHLAGALGKPCWVLLPGVGTDWRWLEEREDSPWYPGAMRLFRQKEIANWVEVVTRVTNALTKFRHIYCSRLPAIPAKARLASDPAGTR